MKYALILLVFSFPLLAQSQTKSAHLVRYEASINPIFSKVLKKINFSLDKVSLIDSTKSIIFLKIDIADRKSELVGSAGSVGLSGNMFGSGGAGIIGGLIGSSFNSSKQYLYRNTTGSIIINKPQFDTLFAYFSKISELIKSNSDEPKFYDISYNFAVDKLEINLEFTKKKYTENDSFSENRTNNTYIEKYVYFKIDDSIFGFKEDEFIKIFNEEIAKIKLTWESNKTL